MSDAHGTRQFGRADQCQFRAIRGVLCDSVQPDRVHRSVRRRSRCNKPFRTLHAMVRILNRHLSRSRRVKTILMGLYFYISVSVLAFRRAPFLQSSRACFRQRRSRSCSLDAKTGLPTCLTDAALLSIQVMTGMYYYTSLDLCIVCRFDAVPSRSGKSTFCNFLQLGPNQLQEPPTVGLNVKMLSKGGVQLKVWDIGTCLGRLCDAPIFFHAFRRVQGTQLGLISMHIFFLNCRVALTGGQHQFREEWPRYCKGVDCIIFVVDTSDVRLIGFS